jgi:hypothetical protein
MSTHSSGHLTRNLSGHLSSHLTNHNGGIISLDGHRGKRKGRKKDSCNPLVLLIVVISIIILLLIATLVIIGSNDSNYNSSMYTTTSNDNKMKSLLLANNNNNIVDSNYPKNNTTKPVVIAYVISLIKCGDMHSTSEGMSDAAMVLRHSVHLTSIRNHGISKYDYKMFAIVHKDAESCSQTLRDAGFEIMIRDVPIQVSELSDAYLRQYIHRALCCGHDEFIKLYAYTMVEYPIVVHIDVDFTFHKPMDHLYDAMLYDANSPEGIAARARIELERQKTDVLPQRIDCFMTRDWPQVIPGRKPGYQAGFLIIRPDMDAFYTIVNVIKTTNFVPGFARSNGWGGKGMLCFYVNKERKERNGAAIRKEVSNLLTGTHSAFSLSFYSFVFSIFEKSIP